METILRVFQFFLALGLIGVVLLQRSEGGGLGIGSSGSAGSFMSVRGTANFLTRLTAILAGLFMVTCLVLALMAKPSTTQRSIFDTPVAPAPTTNELPAPAPAPAVPEKTPAAPESSAPPAAAVPAPAAPAAAAPPAVAPETPAPAAPAPVVAPPPAAAAQPEASAPKAQPGTVPAKPKPKKAVHPSPAKPADQ